MQNTDRSSKCDFIGMLHVPINSIMVSPIKWRESMELPDANLDDWKRIDAIEEEFSASLINNPHAPFRTQPDSEIFARLEEETEQLSFFKFLHDRMLTEAGTYFNNGADVLMMENIGAPYFVRDRQSVTVFAVMSLLAKKLREAHPEKRFGIQILAFSDDLALEIALRNRFEFVRSESAIFAGLRPEGPTPNHGNLAGLYAVRNCWQALMGIEEPIPHIYIDLCKKHTFFPVGLEALDKWIENLLFQKVEGAILTGAATGMAVSKEDMHRLRQAIDAFGYNDSIRPWKTRLLIGSGVSIENVTMCQHYADGVIVGSSLKKDGYWENPLDGVRLKRFSEKWHSNKAQQKVVPPQQKVIPPRYKNLILASTSPQRKRILDEIGIKYCIAESKDVEEITLEKPQETVVNNAQIKLRAALLDRDVLPGMVVLAADTVLSTGVNSIGKPGNAEEAKTLLKSFSNKSITAYSAIALARKGDLSGKVAIETATIEFNEISEDLIDWYIKTGEPLSRAGAFGVSLLGEVFVKSICGSFSCIAGLPKKALIHMLSRFYPECIAPPIPASEDDQQVADFLL